MCRMNIKRLGTALAAVALTSTTLTVSVAASADAAQGRKFKNCTALTKVYPHGVAKGPKAAKKQVNRGYGRPAHGKKARAVYKRNKGNLDRDKDGTACER